MGKQGKEDLGDVTEESLESKTAGEMGSPWQSQESFKRLQAWTVEAQAWGRRLEGSLHSPGRQAHWKPLSWSWQSAWFKQGDEAHSSVSISQSRPSTPEDRAWWWGLRSSQASAQEARDQPAPTALRPMGGPSRGAMCMWAAEGNTKPRSSAVQFSPSREL